MDYGTIRGFSDIGQNGFASPTSFFDASNFSGPDTAMGQSFNFGGGMGAPGGGMGLGFNLPTLNGIVGGIGALGSLWGGLQQQKLAKKAFKFQKNMSLINLANQVKSYNTALADRSRSRGVMESQSQATQNQYIQDNSLSTKR